MTVSILIWVVIAVAVGAFFFGRAYEAGAKPVGGIPMPKLEGVDPWLALFREYRASYREESLATVYTRWRELCGYHSAVAEYVARLGVYDPKWIAGAKYPPGSAVS